MILNAMGFTGRPLYLTPRFYDSRPVDTLIREGLNSKDFHDYSLGAALDKLYECSIRSALKEEKTLIWNQKDNPTDNPTA